MNRFNGLVICGKRGGSSFKDMVRPTVVLDERPYHALGRGERKYACPQGHVPCNDFFFDARSEGFDYVVCIPEGVEKETECPITSIAFRFGNNSGNPNPNPSSTGPRTVGKVPGSPPIPSRETQKNRAHGADDPDLYDWRGALEPDTLR